MATVLDAHCAGDRTVRGVGSPVLLLPGWCAASSGWGALLPRLEAAHSVITVDDRRALRVPDARRTRRIVAMVDDAVAVLDEAGASAAHVVGNSLGGLVAQALACWHPERVLSLVLLSTSLGTPSIPSSPVLLMDGLRRLVRTRDRGGRPVEERRLSVRHGAQLLAALGWCGLRSLPQVRARTLVIHGSRDRVVPLTNARLMANLVPGAQLLVIDGAGHLILTDAPGKDAYPISGFTWLLVYKDQPDAQKGDALVRFLWWAIHDGQKMAAALDYAPLPAPLVRKVEATLKSITVQGKAVLAERK